MSVLQPNTNKAQNAMRERETKIKMISNTGIFSTVRIDKQPRHKYATNGPIE